MINKIIKQVYECKEACNDADTWEMLKLNVIESSKKYMQLNVQDRET